jgi:hypothetical protein
VKTLARITAFLFIAAPKQHCKSCINSAQVVKARTYLRKERPPWIALFAVGRKRRSPCTFPERVKRYGNTRGDLEVDNVLSA